MPHKDGWQVLHELKTDVATRDIPVVLLSIVDQKDLGYRLGAFDYLLKPFDREAILAALRRISPAHRRLLVVDDDAHVVDLVRQLLEDQPYEIEAAVDGQAALEAMAQRQPDVILLDLLMPHLDGFGVLEYLHRTPRYRDIPVIVLTARTCTAEEQALLHARVRAVIQKQGLERDGLLQEVRAALLAYRTTTEEA
jgi:CheY-like chemotaxis protein